MRPIDADALATEFVSRFVDSVETIPTKNVIGFINSAPTIDTVPRGFLEKYMRIEIRKRIELEKRLLDMARRHGEVVEFGPWTIGKERKTDVVSMGTFEQVKWERDTAVSQLEEIGKSLGSKMDDVKKVRHGRWKRVGFDIYECSECRQNVMTGDIIAYDFCHGCGAKMDGKEDAE